VKDLEAERLAAVKERDRVAFEAKAVQAELASQATLSAKHTGDKLRRVREQMERSCMRVEELELFRLEEQLEFDRDQVVMIIWEGVVFAFEVHDDRALECSSRHVPDDTSTPSLFKTRHLDPPSPPLYPLPLLVCPRRRSSTASTQWRPRCVNVTARKTSMLLKRCLRVTSTLLRCGAC